jgi:hypothetical protein
MLAADGKGDGMVENRSTGNEGDAAKPDPEDRTAAERRKVEHVSGFQGDKQQMPLEGEKALETDGTVAPPISSLPPEEAARQRTTGQEEAAR